MKRAKGILEMPQRADEPVAEIVQFFATAAVAKLLVEGDFPVFGGIADLFVGLVEEVRNETREGVAVA